MTAALSDCIQGYDEKIEKLGREKYGHTALLRQVKAEFVSRRLFYQSNSFDAENTGCTRRIWEVKSRGHLTLI